MRIFGKSYLQGDIDPINDRFLSPVRTPNHLLSKFPETWFLVGDQDPLLDDSIQMANKLISAGVTCHIRKYLWLGHAFLGFNLDKGQFNQIEKPLFKAAKIIKAVFESL